MNTYSLIRELSVLLEYNRSITLKNWSDKLDGSSKREGQSVEDVLTHLEVMDPTKNKQYVQWLVRQFIGEKFRLEDGDRVKNVLKHFHSLKSRLPIDKRDINRMDLHQLEELIDSILDISLEDESSLKGSREIPPDTEVLYNGPLGLLVVPKTKEASCELGRGTKWCTASSRSDNPFDRYNEQGNLYIWIDKSGAKYQFHFDTLQFTDAQDRLLTKDEMSDLRNNPVLRKLFHREEATLAPWDVAEYAAKYLTELDNTLLSKIISTPHSALQYANKKGVRFPEGEDIIASLSHTAYGYANNILRGRFKKGEEVLAKDARFAVLYAQNVLKGRFPEAEPVIGRDSDQIRSYVTEIPGNLKYKNEIIKNAYGVNPFVGD